MPSVRPRASSHFGLTLLFGPHGRTIFIADSQVHFRPDAEQLADIVVGAAGGRKLWAMSQVSRCCRIRRLAIRRTTAVAPMLDAVKILDERKVDFEYDGEMSPDVALEASIRALYPFCRLTGDANVLVMPGLHSAHILTRLMHHLGGGTTIGPLLIGHGAAGADRADGRSRSARSSMWPASPAYQAALR